MTAAYVSYTATDGTEITLDPSSNADECQAMVETAMEMPSEEECAAACTGFDNCGCSIEGMLIPSNLGAMGTEFIGMSGYGLLYHPSSTTLVVPTE